MSKIVLENISTYGKNFVGIQHLNLIIEDKSFVTILGPSNSCKTSILRLIAGLDTPNEGKITIDDEVVFDAEKKINVPIEERNTAYLYKNCSLIFKQNIYSNIAFELYDVKKDLPLINVTYKRAKQIESVLSDIERLNKVIEASKQTDGKVVKLKLVGLLIQEYSLSSITAKSIASLNIFNEKTQQEDVKKEIENQKAIIKAEEKKAAKLNQTINENNQFEIDGKVIVKKRKLTDEEVDIKVREMARKLDIYNLLDYMPSELSERQQKLVYIARLLVKEPKILLIDDPLNDIDERFFTEMNVTLQRICYQFQLTAVMATQHKETALALSTKIAFIKNGVLIQYDTPDVIYKKATDIFTANYIGFASTNFIDAKLTKENNKYKINLFDKSNVSFTPDDNIDLSPLFEMKQVTEDENNCLKKDDNIEEMFQYPLSKKGERLLHQKKEESDNNVVLGLRAKSITISEDGAFSGEIYSILKSVIHVQIVISVENYLLNLISFELNKYKIGDHIKFNFNTSEVMLFDIKTQKLICNGSLLLDK